MASFAFGLQEPKENDLKKVCAHYRESGLQFQQGVDEAPKWEMPKEPVPDNIWAKERIEIAHDNIDPDHVPDISTSYFSHMGILIT